MILLSTYQGKKVGVFGLGKAGRAAVAALEASGAEVYCWDDSLESSGKDSSKEQEARSGDSASPERGAGALNNRQTHYKNWPWPELAALVLSPGVPLTHPKPHGVVLAAQAAGCRISGEIELLQQACPDALKIGITGTNGKSTTTALIGHILQAAGRKPQVGGNLGTPALALEPLGKDGVYVLEMSSYQLDLMHSVRFNVAVWLNITPDHLDRHGDMKGYVDAKRHLFERQTSEDTAIIGMDDAYSESVAQTLAAAGSATVVPVTIGGKAERGIEVKDGILLDRREAIRIDLTTCKGLKGAHNWQNAACAYAACRSAGVGAEIISQSLQSFSGLEHRMEWVREEDGVVFINDSKATNADSTAKALAAYPADIYWILGGRPKAGGITTLAPYFPRIKHAYLLGEAEAEFAETLQGNVPYTRCGTLEAATRLAAKESLQAGRGVVLLSPACASWDQWPNFEARGQAFKEYLAAVTEGSVPGSGRQASGKENSTEQENTTMGVQGTQSAHSMGAPALSQRSVAHCGGQETGAGALHKETSPL